MAEQKRRTFDAIRRRPKILIAKLNEIDRQIRKLDGDDPCWEWTGPFSDGKAYIIVAGQKRWVHRIMWHRTGIPLWDNERLKRACENPKCVNPAHHCLRPIELPVQTVRYKGYQIYIWQSDFQNYACMFAIGHAECMEEFGSRKKCIAEARRIIDEEDYETLLPVDGTKLQHELPTVSSETLKRLIDNESIKAYFGGRMPAHKVRRRLSGAS